MLHHKGTLWSNKNMRSFENGFKLECKCVSKCMFTYKCKCTRRCEFIDKFWRQVIHMSWMRLQWWHIKRTRCDSLAMTREHRNDVAKTIRNTKEPIENVVKMTTFQNLIAKQKLMMIQSCKAKRKMKMKIKLALVVKWTWNNLPRNYDDCILSLLAVNKKEIPSTMPICQNKL